MNMLFVDAYGLWLKVHRLGTVSGLRLEAKDSILVTWASISLAPIYILLQSFEQDKDKFETGTKDLYIEIPLTRQNIEDIDRLFTRYYLAPVDSLIPTDMLDQQFSSGSDDSESDLELHDLPVDPDPDSDSGSDSGSGVNAETNSETGHRSTVSDTVETEYEYQQYSRQENLGENKKDTTDGFELSSGFGPE
jgi:hypothetical protein